MAAVVSLVDPSAPAINTTNILPTGSQRRGPARAMLQDIARGLARRVPLTKLVMLHADIRPFLAALMVSALHRAGDELVIPDDMKLQLKTKEEFDNFLRTEAGRTYDNYGMIAADLERAYPGTDGRKPSRAQLDREQREHLAKVMERVAYAMHKFAGEDPDFLPPG